MKGDRGKRERGRGGVRRTTHRTGITSPHKATYNL